MFGHKAKARAKEAAMAALIERAQRIHAMQQQPVRHPFMSALSVQDWALLAKDAYDVDNKPDGGKQANVFVTKCAGSEVTHAQVLATGYHNGVSFKLLQIHSHNRLHQLRVVSIRGSRDLLQAADSAALRALGEEHARRGTADLIYADIQAWERDPRIGPIDALVGHSLGGWLVHEIAEQDRLGGGRYFGVAVNSLCSRSGATVVDVRVEGDPAGDHTDKELADPPASAADVVRAIGWALLPFPGSLLVRAVVGAAERHSIDTAVTRSNGVRWYVVDEAKLLAARRRLYAAKSIKPTWEAPFL